MANDQYNVCSTAYEAAAVQCTMAIIQYEIAITYICRRRKGFHTTQRHAETISNGKKTKTINQSLTPPGAS